jgi:hypothetical protein
MPDDPPTLRIDYEVGINEVVSKWVCPEHISESNSLSMGGSRKKVLKV